MCKKALDMDKKLCGPSDFKTQVVEKSNYGTALDSMCSRRNFIGCNAAEPFQNKFLNLIKNCKLLRNDV